MDVIVFIYFLLLRFNFEGGTPPTNFDTFAAAIMTVFQVGRRHLLEVVIRYYWYEVAHIDLFHKHNN